MMGQYLSELIPAPLALGQPYHTQLKKITRLSICPSLDDCFF